MRLTFVAGVAALALLASSAHAEEPPDELDLRHRGAALAVDFESGAFGLASTAEVGFELEELRTTRGRQLLWLGELLVGPTAGAVANTYSPTTLLGARVAADGEVDDRLAPQRTWSPFLGAGGNLQVQALAAPSLGLASYDRVNSLDGIAGVNGAAGLRLAGGVSGLQSARAWQGGLFVQEAFRAPASLGAGRFLTELGARAAYAAAHGLWISLEALGGRAPTQIDPQLHRSSRLAHEELAFALREELGSFWIAFDARASRDSRTDTFASSTQAFETAGPVAVAAVAGAGMALP